MERDRWFGSAIRVIGVWLVSFVAFCVLWIGNAFYEASSWRQAPVAAVLVLLAPAYGWSVAKHARRHDLRKKARGAKVAAIVALAVNVLVLLSFMLMNDALSHMR